MAAASQRYSCFPWVLADACYSGSFTKHCSCDGRTLAVVPRVLGLECWMGCSVPPEDGLCCGCAAVGVTTPHITLTPCSCQSAGDQLSRELEHVKKELERVKGELGTWSWLF